LNSVKNSPLFSLWLLVGLASINAFFIAIGEVGTPLYYKVWLPVVVLFVIELIRYTGKNDKKDS
jgi:hypothetical protein